MLIGYAQSDGKNRGAEIFWFERRTSITDLEGVPKGGTEKYVIACRPYHVAYGG